MPSHGDTAADLPNGGLRATPPGRHPVPVMGLATSPAGWRLPRREGPGRRVPCDPLGCPVAIGAGRPQRDAPGGDDGDEHDASSQEPRISDTSWDASAGARFGISCMAASAHPGLGDGRHQGAQRRPFVATGGQAWRGGGGAPPGGPPPPRAPRGSRLRASSAWCGQRDLVLTRMSPLRPKWRRAPSHDNDERVSLPAVLTLAPRLTGADHGSVVRARVDG
jgi:hypothetical protein